MNSVSEKKEINKMNTKAIEKILNVVCELLSVKWYGYDTNYILRDSFVNDVMSYDYIIDKKWLEYLFIHSNIECNYDSNLIDEYFFENIFDDNIADILNEYSDENQYNVSIIKEIDIFHVYVYEYTNTIKKITCDYKYLSNYEYTDIFE